ncbi:MAG: AAA domain-containing protein [Candidatus Latescibacteria bacterium]|nr:AAA domain-containing protein [Candidatus Latescibacterota bacterium]
MDFIGQSSALHQVQEQLKQVAATDLTVLITGETGTGKGLAARFLHAASPRADRPFVQVNCGALPEGLVESELFGHERGAFTGAGQRRLGKVELAAGGTLFLDEIGDLTAAAQVKLLRLLEEGRYERVGGTDPLVVQARIVAATNRDLPALVEKGQFRRDLFFRLQVFPVPLPPLRQRREDIGLLADYFAARMGERLGRRLVGLSTEALAVLQAYAWPGNVRELEHAIQRGAVVAVGERIQAVDIVLADGGGQAVRAAGELLDLKEHERRYIRAVLERSGWVIKGAGGAAQVLGLSPAALRYRMKKLGIERPA